MVRSTLSKLNRAVARARRDRRGNVTIIFAFAVPLVIGAGGLAVETGFDYVSQSRLQSAADAAAYAGGIERVAASPSDVIRTAATTQAIANGWTASGGTLTVNTPPTSGPNAGAANAVEVQLTQTAPRFFTAFFHELWHGLDTATRSAVAFALPELMKSCLVWDVAPVRSSLRLAGLDAASAAAVADDCYRGDDERFRTICRASLRMCASAGVFEVPGAVDAFVAHGLLTGEEF